MSILSRLEDSELLKIAIEFVKEEMDALKFDVLETEDNVIKKGLQKRLNDIRELVNEWNQRNGIGCEKCGSEEIEEGHIVCDNCIKK